MKIYNQTTLTSDNYPMNTETKRLTTLNFKKWIYIKTLGQINVPAEYNTTKSIEIFLRTKLDGLIKPVMIKQIIAEVTTALGLTNAIANANIKPVANNNKTITPEEEQKLNEYLNTYGFDTQDINKMIILNDFESKTPLMFACKQGKTDIVKILLKRSDLDINIQDAHGYTALIFATFTSDTNIAKSLSEHPEIDVNIQDNTGSSALMRAVSNENTDVAKVLLDNENTDVNIQDAHGYTALIRAACTKNTDTVKALLKHPKTDINIKDNNGKNAIDHMPKIAQIKEVLDESEV